MRKILFLLLFIPVATYAQNLHLKFGGGFRRIMVVHK